MSDYFIFGDFDTRTLANLSIFQRYSRETPEREYERVSVPGMNGDLLFDNERYTNVAHEYGFVIDGNISSTVVAFRNALMSQTGYQRLNDSFETDEYYKAYYSGAMTIRYAPSDTMAKGVLTFERMPQRFLISGETTVDVGTSSYTLENPTLYDAQPVIRVAGSGTLTINGKNYVIDSDSPWIDIDSMKQDCYYNDVNKNYAVSLADGKFPVLIPGDNEFSSTGLTGVLVIPNWWRL